MPSNEVFRRVGGLSPRYSTFDLSYEKKLTTDFGKLIPIMADECIPGDRWKIGNEIVVRFQPMVAPILHEINVYTHYFFVPYRILWPGANAWEDFITGGVDGNANPQPPTWSPPGGDMHGYLWDYMGFPLVNPGSTFYPADWPRRAYNQIYNDYYRDQNLEPIPRTITNQSVADRAWEKDYFTSATEDTQRGTAPSIELTGTAGTIFNGNTNATGTGNTTNGIYVNGNTPPVLQGTGPTVGSPAVLNNFKNWLNLNTIDWSNVGTFDVNQLREVFQLQKWQERSMRAGSRYTEQLQAHYDVHPRDDRLQRPEYIGGSKQAVVVSEVLQTSQSTDGVNGSPQGNMAGHGISAARNFCASYHVKEHGLIMGIMSVMPRLGYMSQGINRQWLRRTKFEYPFPEFVNLGEQAIARGELVTTNDGIWNNDIFGYQGRFDECRTKQSMVCGLMRDESFKVWHLNREFSTVSGQRPSLNNDFIKCKGDGADMRRIFSATSEHGLIVNVANILRATRPLPLQSNPGFIDHM